MMELSSLPKTTAKAKRRLGRGHGSGRGKTAGRGTKGQKAKESISPTFEGGIVSIIKRLPFRRGRGRNKSLKQKPIIVNVKVLNLLAKGATVDVDLLVKSHIVSEEAKELGVKILGEGELHMPLTVALPVSKGASKKIEKAGGKIIV